MEIPYMGKIWSGKNLANLENGAQFTKFFPANILTGDLPGDLPKFSKPFPSAVMIRQTFHPPKFSHAWYYKYSYVFIANFIIIILA